MLEFDFYVVSSALCLKRNNSWLNATAMNYTGYNNGYALDVIPRLGQLYGKKRTPGQSLVVESSIA